MENNPFHNKKTVFPIALFVIFICAFVFYSNSFSGDFVFDDTNIVKYRAVKDIGSLMRRNETESFSRSVLYLTYAIDYSLANDYGIISPLHFHITNFIIHVLTSWGVFTLMYNLVRLIAIHKSRDYAYWTGLFSGTLFTVHPLMTEGVSYISGRSSSLMAFFYIWAMVFSIRSIRCFSFKNILRGYLLGYAALFIFVLSFMSKETAISLPIIAIFLALITLIKWGSIKKTVTNKHFIINFVLFAVLVIYVALSRYETIASSDLILTSNSSLGKLTYPYAYTQTFPRLWSKFFLPAGLCVDNMFQLDTNLASLPPYLCIFSCVLVLYASLSLVKKRPLVAFLYFWIFFTPIIYFVIGLNMVDALSERRMYLPAVGFCGLVGYYLAEVFKNQPKLLKPIVYCFAFVLAFLGLQTIERNDEWKTSVSLWESTHRANPANVRAMINLGLAYFFDPTYDYSSPEMHMARNTSRSLAILKIAYESKDTRNGILRRALSTVLMKKNIPEYDQQALEILREGYRLRQTEELAEETLYKLAQITIEKHSGRMLTIKEEIKTEKDPETIQKLKYELFMRCHELIQGADYYEEAHLLNTQNDQICKSAADCYYFLIYNFPKVLQNRQLVERAIYYCDIVLRRYGGEFYETEMNNIPERLNKLKKELEKYPKGSQNTQK